MNNRCIVSLHPNYIPAFDLINRIIIRAFIAVAMQHLLGRLINNGRSWEELGKNVPVATNNHATT
jgi:hypothetical protein